MDQTTETGRLDFKDIDRKRDHIFMAMESQTQVPLLDSRFNYEPLLSAHPTADATSPVSFAGYQLRYPLWISSMTGGTYLAKMINRNLARAAGEFGIGFALGSCRKLLEGVGERDDFMIREYMGENIPLYANLGIAQVEKLLQNNQIEKLTQMLQDLQADGLIVHINPLQEWYQPEGDRFQQAPLKTIRELLKRVDFPIVVKEVGQGFGPESLRELLKLPLMAIEFAAFGGTNFTQVEQKRSGRQQILDPLCFVGHTASEMLNLANEIKAELASECLCQQLILSGGVQSALDGFYLRQKSSFTSIYGLASRILQHAQGEYEQLKQFLETEIRQYLLAERFLKVKE